MIKDTVGLNVTEAVTLDSVTRQHYFADIVSLGVGWVRIELPIKVIEPSAGQRNWTVADQVVSDAAAAGLQIVAVFAHPPSGSWIADWLGLPVSPPPAAQFGAFVHDVVARYPQVAAWEIWNEQNLHTQFPSADPAQYVPYLQMGYQAAKHANPNTTVLFGGLAAAATASGAIWAWFWPIFWHNADPVEFLTGAYKAGAKGFFDALSYHPYPLDHNFKDVPFDPTDEYIADITKLSQVMTAYADAKPIWCTEFGSDSTTTDQVGLINAELDLLETLPFVARSFIYCYADNSGAHMGLTDGSGGHKPSYGWLKTRMLS